MAKQVKQVHIFLLLKCQIFAGGVLRCLDPVVLLRHLPSWNLLYLKGQVHV